MDETGERRSMDKEQEESPRRPHPAAGGGGGDRMKRDEWSEGAVSSLLEAYESKWVLRNRAKLKGQDWEDVARFVSSRANSTKSPKTQTQCKNKIESMKKRYRSESSAAATDASSSSSWPLYHRLHHLLRGAGASGAAAPPPAMLPSPRQQRHPPPLLLMGPSPALLPAVQVVQPQPAPPPPPPPQPSLAIPSLQMVPPPPATIGAAAQNSHGPTGVDGVGGKEEDRHGAPDRGKYSAGHASERNTDMSAAAAEEEDSDSSTPALVHSDDEKQQKKNNKFGKRVKMKRKSSAGGGGARRTTRSEWGMAESIRWLAEVVVRSEQARMDTAREIEKMRMEAEAKRGEMDLKRTEIVANTQLEIAKLFAAAGLAKGGPVVDSSLRIGRKN
ncbi:unnamed protein product [Linum tenue]|uniref:Myb/SANT-like DNA-binding domain-containing protein n=1 Tax=Linum tenue TaxID=586396 RepID=A0AAV0S2K9_9ROSI|nr:unnamed protein product [Linum tenue]